MATVKLVKTLISGNRYSLGLDAYPAKKRTKRLGLYIPAKPATKLERQQVKDILELAEAERHKAEIALNMTGSIAGQRLKNDTGTLPLFYQRKIRPGIKSALQTWDTAVKYWEAFWPGLELTDISVLELDEFRDYMLMAPMLRRKGVVDQNSAATYFALIKSLLREAFKARLLPEDIGSQVEGISGRNGLPEHFSEAELQQLVNNPCKNEVLKQAALFSALTGLRWSDIVPLSAKNFVKTDGGRAIRFTQEKTEFEELMPVTDEAYSLVPEGYFSSLDYHNCQRALKNWFAAAGVEGSFHKFRHTFATNLVAKGADIYVVSKLMGHKNVKTTQIYAEVAGKQRREAANLLTLKTA